MKANISTLRKPDILILRRQAARLLVLCWCCVDFVDLPVKVT